MPWFTQLAAVRPEQSPGFGPKPVRVEFWSKSDTGTGFFPPEYLSFLCNPHSTHAAYSNLFTTGVV
jgi:hypothetical protein